MARSKKVPLHPWETAKSDGIDRYFRMGYTLATHPAYKRLTHLERHVYSCMCEACAGKREFTFPQACYEKEYGLSKTSVQKAIKGLEAAGFIQVAKRQWQIRQPNVYRFITEWRTRKEPP